MTPGSPTFPVRRLFVQTYAQAKGVDYAAHYQELLERVRAHLNQELVKLEQGESFRKETSLLIAEKTVPHEAVLSAYRVVGDLRDEGYAAEVSSDSSYVTGDRLWLAIRLI
jgi:hypothetical protein